MKINVFSFFPRNKQNNNIIKQTLISSIPLFSFFNLKRKCLCTAASLVTCTLSSIDWKNQCKFSSNEQYVTPRKWSNLCYELHCSIPLCSWGDHKWYLQLCMLLDATSLQTNQHKSLTNSQFLQDLSSEETQMITSVDIDIENFAN